MQKQEPGLKLTAPKKFWDRDLTANYKALAKALTKSCKDAIAGNYPAVVADAVEGVLEGLGLKSNDTGEIAWLLIHRAFLRALYELIAEYEEFIQVIPEDPQSLDEAMQLTLILSKGYIDRSFLQHPDDLVVMDEIKQSFTTWLRDHGTDQTDSENISMELPPRFHSSLDIEWSRRPGEYKPLKDAFDTPFIAPPLDIAELRNTYFTHLRESYRSLDLKGIPGVVDAVRKTAGIELESIFVPLRFQGSTSSGEASLGRNKATKAPNWNAEETNALVVLGDPGSGKSTLLKYRILQLVNEKSRWLPIIIPLNAYADALKSVRLPLRNYFSDYFAGRQHRLASLQPLFEYYIHVGRAVFLLDGLDEVQAERSVVVGLVDDFIREVQPQPAAQQSISTLAWNKVIVTSRFVGYQEAPLTDRRWRAIELTDWGKEEIARFVERWTYAVERAIAGGEENETVRIKAKTERKELQEAILSNKSITRLAGNPLLLTILALIKRQGVTLSNRRVELYELYLRTLLESWGQIRALDYSPVGPKGDYYALVQVLAPLALWLREENPQGGLIHRELLMKFLINYYTKSMSSTRPRVTKRLRPSSNPSAGFCPHELGSATQTGIRYRY